MELEDEQGYKQSEIGLIPKDWKTHPLYTISEKVMVGIASAATHAYRNTGIILFRNQNIKPNYLNDNDVLHITANYESLFKGKRLKGGDLLTARTGYPGTTCVVPAKYENTQSFTTLITRPIHKLVLSNYLSYYINSERGISFFERSKIGGGQKNVNAGILKFMPIPLPPTLKEQQAIARALSDVDKLINNLAKLIEKKKAIKQGAMQQLLTPPHKGGKRLPGFDGDWLDKKLLELLKEKPAYGINAPAVEFNLNLFCYLRITDISDSGEYIDSNKVSVNHSDSTSFILREGELVLARTGASVGKSYLYNPKDGLLVYAGFLIKLSPESEKLNPLYLKFYLQTKQYWNWVTLMSMRSGQPGINGIEYGSLIIPLPPSIQEQNQIASILSNMDKEIKTLETKKSKCFLMKQGMMQELLTGKIRLI